MAALSSFKTICGPLQLLLLLLQDLVESSQPQIEGPQGRITAGSWASFHCYARESSKPIQVNWMKDGKRIESNQTSISSDEKKGGMVRYVTSEVAILLGQGDMRSQLTCQILHKSQKAERNFSLGDVLRVPPKMRLETIPPSPVQLNASVMVACKAEHFYPEDAEMELFAKDDPNRKGMVAQRILNHDGSFSLNSYLEVRATEDRNASMFLCQVQQDSQPWINETTTLFIKKSENSQKQSIITLCIVLFLIKIAILLFILIYLILIKVRNTTGRSGASQEVRLFETSS